MTFVRPAMMGLTCILLGACGQGAQAPRTLLIPPIMATAPKGIDDALLGVPVDVHFQRIPGSAGRSLFAGSPIRRLPQTFVSHDATTISDRLSLEANLSAWKVNANTAYDTTSRFGSYRAFQIVGISSIDDAADLSDEPPNGAEFYVSKVFWGHSYEAVFEGNSRSFGAGLGVELAKFSGGINTFAANKQMKLHFVGSGLTPKANDALFARTPADVMSAYAVSSAPVPIFVEYRLIPRRPSPANEALRYELPVRVTVRFKALRIQDDDTLIGRSTWNLSARCAVAGAMGQAVSILPFNSSVKEGEVTSLNQTLTLDAAPGDSIECIAEGTDGPKAVAPARSQQFQIAPGRFPMTIAGTGRVTYSIDAEVEAQAMR